LGKTAKGVKWVAPLPIPMTKKIWWIRNDSDEQGQQMLKRCDTSQVHESCDFIFSS
jgi:hypothetical protein